MNFIVVEIDIGQDFDSVSVYLVDKYLFFKYYWNVGFYFNTIYILNLYFNQ